MSNALRSLLRPQDWPAFARGMVAYGSAEAVTRVVRIGALLVIARQISPEMLGGAAVALSLFELIRVLTSVGIGQRIIAARADELSAICNAAHRLFWIVCLCVFAIQIIFAIIAGLIFGLVEVSAMLTLLAGVYLCMPAGLVQIFLAMRDQRMSATARVAAMQNVADCLLTAVLAIAWPSAWAIVLPKLLTAPIWLILARRTFAWSPDRSVTPASIAEFAHFGPAILGTELLGAIRIHGDKLLIGALLGTEALGLYYFAFNAGLGITLSLVSACNLVLFPQLAKVEAAERRREYLRAMLMSCCIIVPLVAGQALLAPYYVPVVFGEKWIASAPYLALLACAAIPLFSGALVGACLRAEGRPFEETFLNALATLTAMTGLITGAQFSLAFACIGFGLGLALILLPAAALPLLPPRHQSPIQSEGA